MNSVDLSAYGRLIADTVLPDNHDEVLAEWRHANAKIRGNNFAVTCDVTTRYNFNRVVLHIEAEKERVAKEAAAKAASASTQIETAVPVCPHCHRAMFLAGKSYRCDCITHH